VRTPRSPASWPAAAPGPDRTTPLALAPRPWQPGGGAGAGGRCPPIHLRRPNDTRVLGHFTETGNELRAFRGYEPVAHTSTIQASEASNRRAPVKRLRCPSNFEPAGRGDRHRLAASNGRGVDRQYLVLTCRMSRWASAAARRRAAVHPSLLFKTRPGQTGQRTPLKGWCPMSGLGSPAGHFFRCLAMSGMSGQPCLIVPKPD
jgi:hypothetical protein